MPDLALLKSASLVVREPRFHSVFVWMPAPPSTGENGQYLRIPHRDAVILQMTCETSFGIQGDNKAALIVIKTPGPELEDVALLLKTRLKCYFFFFFSFLFFSLFLLFFDQAAASLPR